MSEPATKEDVSNAVAELRAEVSEMKTELRAEMATKQDLAAMETTLIAAIRKEVSDAARGLDENWRGYFSAVDEKYAHLPEDHKQLRDKFDDHSNDFVLHVPRAISTE